MLQIFGDHLIRDVAAAPRPVADGPEMPSPILFFELGKLFLQPPGRAAFEPSHYFTDGFRRGILHQHMHVVATDNPFEDTNIFSITDLHQQIATPLLDVALQNGKPILRDPHNMHGQTRNRVGIMPIFAHRLVLHRRQMSSN